MGNKHASANVVQCIDLCAGYVRKRESGSSGPSLLFRLLEVKQAIGPITYDLLPGQLTGVIGNNGAGKSTFLKALASSLPLISGQMLCEEKPASIIELGSPRSQWMTGRQFVQDYLELSALMRPVQESQEELIREAEAFAAIGAAYDQPLATYSSGMRARVLFAAAFAGSTPYVLLDEILSVGDAVFTVKCWRLIQQKLAQGMGGFLVTHDWSSVLRLCGHCLWLDQGRVRLSGSPQNVVAKYLNQEQHDQTSIFKGLCLKEYRFQEDCWRLSLIFTCTDVIDIPLQVAVSIEDVGQGRGWQIVALTQFQQLTPADKHQFVLQLEPIRLVKGSYEICLFVKALDSDLGLAQTYSWFTGSAFPVNIKADVGYLLSSSCDPVGALK
jgi:lipopolysaccharide transport system ATP-binding protein